jgi:type IV secretory pathway VirB3-like protein
MKTYPLFTGMTRPAMFLGVPLQFFILSLFPCICIFIVSEQFLMTLAAFALLYTVGFLAALKDERFLEIGLGLLHVRCPNKTFWSCNSYDAA